MLQKISTKNALFFYIYKFATNSVNTASSTITDATSIGAISTVIALVLLAVVLLAVVLQALGLLAVVLQALVLLAMTLLFACIAQKLAPGRRKLALTGRHGRHVFATLAMMLHASSDDATRI